MEHKNGGFLKVDATVASVTCPRIRFLALQQDIELHNLIFQTSGTHVTTEGNFTASSLSFRLPRISFPMRTTLVLPHTIRTSTAKPE